MLAIAARFAIALCLGIRQDFREGCPMQQRRVKLFRNGGDQAIRIPVEFEIPGDEALIYREGDRLVIEPVIEPVLNRSLLEVLAALVALDENFPDVDEKLPSVRDVDR